MPMLRPASQANPMHNPREETSVVLRDTIRQTWWCVYLLTLFDVTTSTYREGGIGSRETLCHDIYRAWPITTISMAANTYCMMDGHSSSALMTGQHIQEEAICYQWFKQRLILSVPEPSISQRSQVKEDTVELSVPARDFNLKEYAAITWQWFGQPGPWTQTHRSPQPGSAYRDATNSATEAASHYGSVQESNLCLTWVTIHHLNYRTVALNSPSNQTTETFPRQPMLWLTISITQIKKIFIVSIKMFYISNGSGLP